MVVVVVVVAVVVVVVVVASSVVVSDSGCIGSAIAVAVRNNQSYVRVGVGNRALGKIQTTRKGTALTRTHHLLLKHS